jgi:hypothetical protein
MSLAPAKGAVPGLVLCIVDVRHDEKASAKPCDDLFAVVAAHGDEEGWA